MNFLLYSLNFFKFFSLYLYCTCRDLFHLISEKISNKLFDFDKFLCNIPKDTSKLNLEVFPYINKIKFIQDLYSLFGVEKVYQVFPEEDGPYLSSLFVLNVDSTKLQSLIKSLQQDNRVKRVEVAIKNTYRK